MLVHKCMIKIQINKNILFIFQSDFGILHRQS